MRYTVEIEIDLARDKVIELFDSAENLFKWQEGLKEFEHLSGEPGQPGAKSKMVFEFKGRPMELIETITVRNLPDEFSGTYDADKMHNIVANRFIETGPQRTKWVSENEFQMTGLMKWISPFIKGMFRKQSLKYMEDFKAFAERGVDANAS